MPSIVALNMLDVPRSKIFVLKLMLCRRVLAAQ
ncbi:hypothetical protein ACLK17_20870 [Escherichia coli]